MLKEGHIGLGLIIYSPIGLMLINSGLLDVFALGIIGICFWSVAPDVDIILPIPHRGPTHTVLAAGVAGFITAAAALYMDSAGSGGSGEIIISSTILTPDSAVAFGFLIGFLGVISHLIGDVLTVAGLQPWQPFSDREHGLRLVLSRDKRVNHGLLTLGSVALAIAIVGSNVF